MRGRPEPSELDVARQVRDIERGVPHRAAAMGPDFVMATARLMALQLTGATLGFRETMRLAKHLHELEMTPLARAQACGHWPWEVDPDGGGDDDAA